MRTAPIDLELIEEAEAVKAIITIPEADIEEEETEVVIKRTTIETIMEATSKAMKVKEPQSKAKKEHTRKEIKEVDTKAEVATKSLELAIVETTVKAEKEEVKVEETIVADREATTEVETTKVVAKARATTKSTPKLDQALLSEANKERIQ